jgi:hypothetical protein
MASGFDNDVCHTRMPSKVKVAGSECYASLSACYLLAISILSMAQDSHKLLELGRQLLPRAGIK